MGGTTLVQDGPGVVPAESHVPAAVAGVHLTPRRVRLVFLGLMLALLLAALEQMIVATALPKIVGELHGLDRMSWAITASLLTATVGLPVYGKLGDLLGRKGVFQFAIVVFVVGAALAGPPPRAATSRRPSRSPWANGPSTSTSGSAGPAASPAPCTPWTAPASGTPPSP